MRPRRADLTVGARRVCSELTGNAGEPSTPWQRADRTRQILVIQHGDQLIYGFVGIAWSRLQRLKAPDW